MEHRTYTCQDCEADGMDSDDVVEHWEEHPDHVADAE